MSAASNYVENNVINSLLRGVAFPVPASIYIALHTADPNETGAAEVTTTAWPSYERKDSADGGTLSAAWSAPANGVSKNQNQVLFPVYDGSGALTVTHFSLFDAATGGNMLVGAPLSTARTIQPSDVFVVDVEKLTVQVL